MHSDLAWPIAGLAAVVCGWWWIIARRLQVEAWTGLSAIEDPAAAIALARRVGVDRLCVFVNDVSFAQGAFRTYNRASILAACDAFHAAGLKVTIVSWMTPRADWIGPGARELGQLAADCRADELDLDLEEPWTAIRSQSDAQISAATATLFESLRSTFRGRILVDCIVYTDLRALGPAIKLSDGVIPQAYTVAVNPPDLERKAVERFKAFGKPIVMGIAGYWRSNPYEPTTPQILAGVLARVSALGVRRVRVWRLEMLGQSLGAELIAWKSRAPAQAVA